MKTYNVILEHINLIIKSVDINGCKHPDSREEDPSMFLTRDRYKVPRFMVKNAYGKYSVPELKRSIAVAKRYYLDTGDKKYKKILCKLRKLLKLAEDEDISTYRPKLKFGEFRDL